MRREIFAAYPRAVVDRFLTYHEAHPEVYERFCSMAYQLKRAGRPRYSARTLMEVVRWHFDVKDGYQEPFKINDNYTPLYVRLFLHEHPQYEGFFELRTVRSKGRMSPEERERRAHLPAA